MRLDNVSLASSGIASVTTVAIAAIAANTIAKKRVSWKRSSSKFSMTRSEIEIDHLAHDHDAHRHPECASRQQQLAGRRGPQELDVGGAGHVDEHPHHDRKRADDARGGLRLHRHGVDLALHLLAIAQHAREVA